MKVDIQVGDKIRGYDFKPMDGREDSFVEGIVEVVNSTEQYFNAFKVTCTKDVFGGENQTGKHSRVGKIVYIPHRVDFMEYPGRVMNLTR